MSDLEVDILIVGAGPAGLYGAYYVGERALSCAVVDSLSEVGGQVTAMYPEKQIYDVAGFPAVTGRDLVRGLTAQAAQRDPVYLLGQEAEGLEKLDDGRFRVTTSKTEVSPGRNKARRDRGRPGSVLRSEACRRPARSVRRCPGPRQRLPIAVEIFVAGARADLEIEREIGAFRNADLVGADDVGDLAADRQKRARREARRNVERDQMGIFALVDIVHEAGDDQGIGHGEAERASGNSGRKAPQDQSLDARVTELFQ